MGNTLVFLGISVNAREALIALGALSFALMLPALRLWQGRRVLPVLIALPFLALCWIGCAAPGVMFWKTGRYGPKIETAAGIWTLCMYLLIGGVPMLLDWIAGGR